MQNFEVEFERIWRKKDEKLVRPEKINEGTMIMAKSRIRLLRILTNLIKGLDH